MDYEFSEIYLLTDEDKEMMIEHKLFYDDFRKYGKYISDKVFEAEVIEDYELTIMSALHRVLELIDTLSVMTEQSLINSSYYILRVLLESAVQLRYIIDSEITMQKKAIILQMLDVKRTAIDEERYFRSMEETQCYKDYVQIIRNGKYSNWYSYCEGKKVTLEGLFKLVEWEDLYKDIYGPLSREIHGVTHMESNIDFINGIFYFKSFRTIENHNSLMTNILATIVPLYSHFFKVYSLSEMEKEWFNYEKNGYGTC